MMSFLINSGLWSVALWAALFLFVVALVAWLRSDRNTNSLQRVFNARLFLAAILFGVLFNTGLGIYKAYIAPRDVMQDIISAREFNAGRSLFPDHMNELMREALAEESRPSPFFWSENMREREKASLEETLSQHWVQAHPPLLSVAVAPLVAWSGPLGAQIGVFLACLAGLFVTLSLLNRGLELNLSRQHWLLLFCGILAAEPVVSSLRNGQVGLLLGGLLTVGWYGLRTNRPVLAGASIALAASLKAFPGLIFVYLLIRHPRVFLIAVAFLLGFMAVPVVLTGNFNVYREFLATSQEVTEEYAAFPANWSLLGLVARFLGSGAHPQARLAYMLLALMVTLVALWVTRVGARRGTVDRNALDLEFALFVALAPALSPVAWDHYLSVLVFPLVVLGRRVLAASAPRGAAVAFFGLLIVLCIPETTFTEPYKPFALGGSGPTWLVLTALYMPLRTYVIFAIAGWLGVLLWRERRQTVSEPAGTARLVPGPAFVVTMLLLVMALVHMLCYTPSEPYFNNDETRHVMTGVFVRDALVDRPFDAPRDYAVRYYSQYPALGLLVWPPFFYFVEGVAMLFLGTSFLVAKMLIGLFAGIALTYLFFLARATHGQRTAVLATLFLGLSPLMFQFSSQVMLEVPTLALALMATFHFHRYLAHERRLDLALCCAATALTALTRFDGIFLAPLFLIWLIARRQLRLLARPSVIVGMLTAILVVAPVYYLTAKEMGGAHLTAVKSGTMATSTGFLAAENFSFYPLSIPEQMGWFLVPLIAIGFVAAVHPSRRAASWPYLATILAVYITFTPMAELEARHAIYWVPALAVLAADGYFLLAAGIAQASRRRPALHRLAYASVGAAVLMGTAQASFQHAGHYVRGYEETAVYVVQNNRETPVCLIDAYLNGDFIYHLRRHDSSRRLWALRGDKLFYGMLSDPHGGYEEYARSQDDVLSLIHKYDPELIVLEEPLVEFDLPGARLLRDTVKAHPERFYLEKRIPVHSDQLLYEGVELRIYRNMVRNPKRSDVLDIKMMGLGRSLEARLR